MGIRLRRRRTYREGGWNQIAAAARRTALYMGLRGARRVPADPQHFRQVPGTPVTLPVVTVDLGHNRRAMITRQDPGLARPYTSWDPAARIEVSPYALSYPVQEIERRTYTVRTTPAEYALSVPGWDATDAFRVALTRVMRELGVNLGVHGMALDPRRFVVRFGIQVEADAWPAIPGATVPDLDDR